MIVGPYNFDDQNTLRLLIHDLKSEAPQNDQRNIILDKLEQYVTATVEQSQDFEQVIDRRGGKITTKLDRNLSELSVMARKMDAKIQEIRRK
jgi:hypothetical protein